MTTDVTQALAHAAELLAARDALDVRDPSYEDRDGEAWEAVVRAAGLVDLRGLELWAGGDLPRCLGRIVAVEEANDGPVLVLANGRREPLEDALVIGWLQYPDDDDADDLEATLAALRRRLAETASADA